MSPDVRTLSPDTRTSVGGTQTIRSQLLRQRILIGIAVLVLAMFAASSLWDVRLSQHQLDEARSDLREVREKLSEIAKLRTRRPVAALEMVPPASLSERVSRALGDANLVGSALLEVEPGPAVRIDPSEFKLRSTKIRLAPIRIEQTLQFCDTLQDDETGSVVRDLILKEPRAATTDADELWEVELVLTQMIYSPTSR